MRTSRQELADARETLLWLGAFPDRAEQFGLLNAAALGLREPIERTLSTKAQLPYASLVAALEEDAKAVARTFTPEQARRLGETVERTPLEAAMWDSDPEFKDWARDELKRAQQLAEFGDPARLSEEARDFRPDP